MISTSFWDSLHSQDADDTAIMNDCRQRVVDQFSLPAGEWFVAMLGAEKAVDDFALTLEKRVAIGNKIDCGFVRCEGM